MEGEIEDSSEALGEVFTGYLGSFWGLLAAMVREREEGKRTSLQDEKRGWNLAFNSCTWVVLLFLNNFNLT